MSWGIKAVCAITAASQLAWIAGAGAVGIGTADSVIPATTYTRSGAAHGLLSKDPLEQDDIILTAHEGSTQVRFLDDTMLTIGPDAEVLLDKAIFDGSQAKTLTVQVVRGALRFVSGMSNRTAYEIKTPGATIGVRGTVVDILREGDRTIVNFVDGSGTICLPTTRTCRTSFAGEAPWAVGPKGFARATAAEAQKLWRRLDGAHLALARQAGRDPSAASGAAAGQGLGNKAAGNDDTTGSIGPSGDKGSKAEALKAGGDAVVVPPAPFDKIINANAVIPRNLLALSYNADAKSRTYGSPNPEFTGTVTGFQSPDTQATATTGTLTFTSPATATTPVGHYAINGSGLTVIDTDYNSTFLQADGNATALTVTTRPVTVTADAKSKTYGNADPALTFATTSLGAGVPLAGALARDAGETVGAYAITRGSVTDAANSNYAITYVPANLTIDRRDVTVTASAQSKIYGDANPALTFTNSSLGTGTAISGALATDATNASNVGTYGITQGGVTNANNSNYNITSFTGANLTISPKGLVYTADPKSRAVGSPNPAFTGTVTGFVLGDTQLTATTGTLTFTSAATASDPAGSYAILGSGLTANNGNYTFTQAPGNATALTITGAASGTGPNFPADVTVFRFNGTGGPDFGAPVLEEHFGQHRGFGYIPRSGLVFDANNTDVLSAVITRTPNLADEPFPLTLTRGSAHITDVHIGKDSNDTPIYYLSSWTNGTGSFSQPAAAGPSGDFTLGLNQSFQSLVWSYTGDLFPGPTVPFGGKVLFDFEAATAPTWSNGQSASGTFSTSGKVAVAIGTMGLHYGVVSRVTMTEGTFEFQTEGGIDNPTRSGAFGLFTSQTGRVQTGGSVTYTDSGSFHACTGGCRAVVEFNTVAQGKVGVIYRIGDGVCFDCGGSPEIEGIAVFAKNGAPVAIIGARPAGFVAFTDTSNASSRFSANNFASGTLQVTANGAVLQSVQLEGAPAPRTKVSAVSTEVGSVPGILSWERWAGGTFTNEAGQTVNIPANSGLHFTHGTLATNLPSNQAGAASPGLAVQYSPIGATSPTVTDGSISPGTLLGTSKVGVNFGPTPTVGVDLNVAFGTGASVSTYELKTTGGASDPSNGGIPLASGGASFFSGADALGVTVSGTPSGSIGCTANTCKATVVGFLAGSKADPSFGGNFNGETPSHLGLNYYFGDPNAPNAKVVNGAAAFARDLPVADLVGYAFAIPSFTGAGTALGNGPALAIGDTTTASGLSLGSINVDSNGNGNSQNFSRGAFGSNPNDAIVGEQGAVAGILSWERWTAPLGATRTIHAGTSCNSSNCPSTDYTVSNNQGVHVISGKAATNIPTTATYAYDLTGGTKPTVADGSSAPGTILNTSKMGVTFGSTPKVGVDLKVDIAGGSYNVKSTGGAFAPSLSAANLMTSGAFDATGIPTTATGTNIVCPSGCTGSVNGFLSGNGASNLGIVYQFGSSAVAAKMVSGAAGFGNKTAVP
jgi:hypothetical protein